MFAIPVDYVEDFFLGVAIRHFAARGLADASVNEIADEAGLSRSAMCNYFDGRNDLVDAVGVAAVGKASAALGDPAPSPTQRLLGGVPGQRGTTFRTTQEGL
ncbi:MAG TPA: TetR/AcrR family transcriptional regulator, partial [Micromonospora sp.]